MVFLAEPPLRLLQPFLATGTERFSPPFTDGRVKVPPFGGMFCEYVQSNVELHSLLMCVQVFHLSVENFGSGGC